MGRSSSTVMTAVRSLPGQVGRALARLSTSERICLLLMAASTAFVYWFGSTHHEFWRDEVQPMLIGRAAFGHGFWHILRVEGVPPLFFLFVRVVDAVLPPPHGLAAVGAIGHACLLAGTYRTLCFLSRNRPGSMALTAALALTDVYIHEFGVVVRQYGLGLGLALWGFALLGEALLSERRSLSWAGVALASAAALTSAHAACIAGAALLSYSIIALVRASRAPDLLPCAAALPAFLLTFWIISPYEDRTAEAKVIAPLTWALVSTKPYELFVRCIANGGWWQPAVPEYIEALLSKCCVPAIVTSLVVATIWPLQRRLVVVYSVLTLVAGSVTILYILIVRYTGGYRHHWFYVLPVVLVACGLALGKSAARRPGAARQLPLLLLVPWFVCQYRVTYVDLTSDYEKPFSQTMTAAASLPPHAVVVAEPDFMAIGILFWRPDITYWTASGGGRALRYLIADKAWHTRQPTEPLVRRACGETPSGGVFNAASGPLQGPLFRCAHLHQARSSVLVRTESFDLWRIDCGCLLSGE